MSSPVLRPVVEAEEEVYTFTNANNGAGPMWCHGSTCLVRLGKEVFARYMRLFEALPTSLLFDRTIFVHAGIPRDDTIAERVRGLASLNDPDVRFQMMWSDPSDADAIPLELQKANARFPFGRKQLRAFLGSLGAGVVGAVLLDKTDTRFRYPEQVSTDMGLTILGVVPRVSRENGNGRNAPQVIEALRSIRNLTFGGWTSSTCPNRSKPSAACCSSSSSVMTLWPLKLSMIPVSEPSYRICPWAITTTRRHSAATSFM